MINYEYVILRPLEIGEAKKNSSKLLLTTV